jgi:sulfite reductase alpha subunit-like flavoprotein
MLTPFCACCPWVQIIRFGRGPHRRTVYKLFTQYLDLFGKPSREFLKKLFPFAEAEALGALGPMAEKP